MHIVVFGGTYNPIHNGHLLVAKRIIKEYAPDMCLMPVTNDTPDKEVANDVSALLRFEMLQRALRDVGNSNIVASDIEIIGGGRSYTVNTLEQLHTQYANARLSLVVGSDRICTFEAWQNPKRICELCDIIVVRRQDDYNEEAVNSAITCLRQKYGAKLSIAGFFGPHISSTEVRQRVFEGLPICEYVPLSTESYIYENLLYEPDYIKNIALNMKTGLSTKRYMHCISTMRTAVSLAYRYGADGCKCRLAGLLHDCQKIKNVNYLALAAQYGVVVDNFERVAPGLLHAKLSAYAAKNQYGIVDEDVLNAISNHTLCRIGMSDTEKIIYVADKTEALRHYPGVEGLRAASMRGLDCGVVACMDFTLEGLKSTGRAINPMLNIARDYLISGIK